MNKRVLTLAATTLGAVAIVGAGFSAWYFTEELDGAFAEDEKKVQTVVTEAKSEVGTFEVTNGDTSIYLVLDQGGVENAAKADEGIYLVTTAPSSTPTTVGSITGENDANVVKTISATWKVDTLTYEEIKNSVSYEVDVTFSEALSAYVTNADVTDNTATYTLADAAVAVDQTTTVGTTVVTLTWTVCDFSYVTKTEGEGDSAVTTNMKPQTFEAYQEMVAALGLATGDVAEETIYTETGNTLLTITFRVVNTANNG